MKAMRFSWKNICLPISCMNDTNLKKTTTNPSKEKLLLLTRQTSVPSRVYLSDFSNSTISLNDFSNSFLTDIHIFTLEELKTITQGFSKHNYLGEGGFGEVYKGFVDDSLKIGLKAQPVAVKALKREGGQGHREWLYGGALPWLTRVKILLGAAKGLDFLHKGKKPVIYRDFKPSNILLSSDYSSKLSDFGLATDGSEAEDSNFTKNVMGTEGYAAPEYISADPNKLERIIDPSLEGRYSLEGIRKAAALAYQCLSHNPKSRPTMATVVKTLGPILDLKDIQNGPFVYIVPVAGANDITCKDDDAKVTKEETEKEAKVCPRHRAGRRRRRKHRAMKSRAVYSDTTLYKSLGTSLYTQAE
ncbi:hypothetical protein IGI04_028727 [Brassica rapa subsp. trilocularis]|uniref:Protein kinase domain-containing protein n=1 Tax=Brassica rapa subsp. trilocularis TaxID=1813537 RepID=A0ABQ7L500_BRACM|nr:hypothetical protein IGI04_028727 [Brassica rapa subsp. trilocularis]